MSSGEFVKEGIEEEAVWRMVPRISKGGTRVSEAGAGVKVRQAAGIHEDHWGKAGQLQVVHGDSLVLFMDFSEEGSWKEQGKACDEVKGRGSMSIREKWWRTTGEKEKESAGAEATMGSRSSG